MPCVQVLEDVARPANSVYAAHRNAELLCSMFEVSSYTYDDTVYKITSNLSR
jgi:hypothetical protein